MKILTISPIQKSVLKKDFSYFTSDEKVAVGDVIEVPIRSKKVPAIVLSITNVSDIKTNLRNSTHVLKKINKPNSKSLFTNSFIKTVNELTKVFIGTHGQLINQFVPKEFNNYFVKTKQNKLKNLESSHKVLKTNSKTKQSNTKKVLVTSFENRVSEYQKLIEKSFNKGESIFFYVPTIENTKVLFESLKKEFESLKNKNKENFFIFHSQLSKKVLTKNISECLSEKKPVVIFATSSFTSLPRHDIKTFVVENFSEEEIKISQPFTNVQLFLETLAKNSKAKIIFSNSFFTPKFYKKIQSGEFSLLFHKKGSEKESPLIQTVDMKKIDKDSDQTKFGKKLSIISKELLEKLEKIADTKTKGLMLVSRKGIASYTSCADCSYTVACKHCASPLSLKKIKGRNQFTCNRCHKTFKTEVRCAKCDSWNLKALGIGIEKAHQEITKLVPDLKIFVLSSDTANTPSKVRKITQEFEETPGSILLGTEMALNHIEKPVDYSAIISCDSLFSLADHQNEERYFSIAERLLEKTVLEMLVQTRFKNKKIFDFIEKSDSEGFCKEELRIKKDLGYPPYKVVIKIEINGEKLKVITDTEQLRNVLYKYSPKTTAGKIIGQNIYGTTTNLYVSEKAWPEEKLSAILYSLPTRFKVSVTI